MRPFAPLLVTAALALLGCGDGATKTDAGYASNTTRSVGTADLGGPFSLVDQTGARVSEADFVGQPTLLYFGFSYCPDVCPTALQKLGRAQELMGDAAAEVQFVMITVDPERDTPEQLAVYTTNNGFPKGLRGFTGTVEEIETAKTAYKVYAQKVPMEDSEMGYTVDHQDLIFLLGEDGKFAAFFPPRDTPAAIAARVRRYLATGT